jgi:hypothetical protein
LQRQGRHQRNNIIGRKRQASLAFYQDDPTAPNRLTSAIPTIYLAD